MLAGERLTGVLEEKGDRLRDGFAMIGLKGDTLRDGSMIDESHILGRRKLDRRCCRYLVGKTHLDARRERVHVIAVLFFSWGFFVAVVLVIFMALAQVALAQW